MTTFSPGTGQRIKLLDLGNCYAAGTILNVAVQGNWSASWPGQIKIWDIWYVTGYSLADLAANEAAVDAGGAGYLYHTTKQATSDSTLGGESMITGSGTIPALTATSRYVSLYAKPQFSAVAWHTNDTSTLTLTNVGGASPTSCPVDAPVADFTSDVNVAIVGQTIIFTDLSTNTPTSWAWDFGDGGTSTSQHPTHAYTSPGTRTVSLTATNSDGSDTETKIAYITITTDASYDPPPPAGVLLEIYASAPGSARWDVAKWDEAVWSSAGWQDVTPYGVHVNITWGSNRPELGILSVPAAASWTVDYHDPARILDPANADGPYFGDLKPGLPIRVSHRGTIVRVGIVTGISHNFRPIWVDGPAGGRLVNGYMRATDNISRLANAKVPPDTELADTLYARAVDAIAAAGLVVTVAAPIGTDPAVSPWVTDTHDWSAWQWIADAAQETLRIPIIDRYGTLTFRAWSAPLTRARSLASPELVDLADVSDWAGLFSVIQAREDAVTLVERRLTPAPDYGARTYTRNEITLDPGGWAEAVLADRAMPSLLWKPGAVRPLTADSTEQLATIEAIERVGVTLTEQSPAVIGAGIVVGGEMDVVGKIGDAATWRFRYELAQTATEPLIETGGDPTDYLLATGGDQFLYPST